MSTSNNDKKVEDVRAFWEENPLWTGESQFSSGSLSFFNEHRETYISDCFAGKFDLRTMPRESNRKNVLDLGCGPGFWTVELSKFGCEKIVAADLTENALSLAEKRCSIFDVDASFKRENAEELTFENETFDHVNCQGVIHHTPNTQACVAEIARVLRSGGTASISVYYKNIFLKIWPLICWVGRLLSWLGAGLSGRGREKIYSESDTDEIVRLYDGADNPIGKAYSKKEFVELLSDHFIVEELYLHFFPARSLPFKIPFFLHRILDNYAGFLIYASVKKA